MEAKSNKDQRNSRELSRDIVAAQSHCFYWIGGHQHQRIRFRADRAFQGAPVRCPDCGVLAEQYHVPGCREEICPTCGGEVISCDCAYGVREP